MKTAPFLAASLLAYGAFVLTARADDPSEDPNAWMYDPDGAPKAFIDAYKSEQGETQKDNASNNDKQDPDGSSGLMAEYAKEAQLRAQAGNEPVSAQVYGQFLPAPSGANTSSSTSNSSAVPTPDTPSKIDASLPKAPAAGTAPASIGMISAEPFIKSFDVTPASLSGPPTSSPGASFHLDTGASHTSGGDHDSSILDTPGMTAEKDSMDKDLSLDAPPGESGDEEKAQSALSLTPPIAHNEAYLKQQEAALLVPGQKPKTLPATPINPVLIQAPDDKANMVPVPPPMRVRVADPFDMSR